MTGTYLGALFRGARPADCGPIDEALLEPALRDYVIAARTAWPEFQIEEQEFIRYLAARAPADTLPSAAYAGDLALAFVCARGDTAGAEAFHRCFGDTIARVLARRTSQRDLALDAAQIVHERLLVGAPGQAPKIAEYRAVGPLKSWVSTAAVTTLITLQRSVVRRREQSVPESERAEGPGEHDPERRYLQQGYKAEIEGALRRALTRLGDRQRTLLRLHVGERMSVDQLGVVYGVNRSTAARWIVLARSELAEAAKQEIRACLHVNESEFESIVALVRSQLDVSILRHLAAGAEALEPRSD